MRFCRLFLLIGLLSVTSGVCRAGTHAAANPFRGPSSTNNSRSDSSDSRDCLTIAEAAKHIGKTSCVSGKVMRVEEGNNGVTFLDFCADYRSCAFTVVVFASDLEAIGDLRQLEGRAVTIKGRIEQYDDRAEIILRHPQQLGESAAHLTALPKDYDVERQGHFSAGSFRAKKAKKAKRTRQEPPISIEDPEMP